MMNRTLPAPWEPTKAQLLAARNKLVPDLFAQNLIVLFAGINPGLYTAATSACQPENRVMAPEGWLSGSCHASRIPVLRGARGAHAFFGQEESPCSTLNR